MNFYSNIVINIVSLIISIVLVIFPKNFLPFFTNADFLKADFSTVGDNQETSNNMQEIELQNPKEDINMQWNLKESSKVQSVKTKWWIEIPAINVKADIVEGTTEANLKDNVAHFTETSLWEGNVGLAAHNRGYEKNYFADLKKLKIGDVIIYHYNENQKKYLVTQQKIIEDTDWKDLENTEDDKITLITCVENEPHYRRCVQAEKQDV